MNLGIIKLTKRGVKDFIYSLFFHTAVNKNQEVPQAVHISPLPIGELFHKFYPPYEASQMLLAAEAIGDGSCQWPLIMELLSTILPFPRALCKEIVHFATVQKAFIQKGTLVGAANQEGSTTSLLYSHSSKYNANLTIQCWDKSTIVNAADNIYYC